MAVLTGNQRAILTARCGVARCGVTRCGFAPLDTRNADGTAGGAFYLWSETTPPTTDWTTIRS